MTDSRVVGAAGPEGGVAEPLFPAGAARPPLAETAPPSRSRGSIALLEQNCTSCMLCARECPDWCIEIDSHKEEEPPSTERGRPRQRHVLDRFAIDFGLCMWCGICIEVCPFDALFWSPELVPSSAAATDLIAERDVLRELLAEVPPPEASDPAAQQPPAALP